MRTATIERPVLFYGGLGALLIATAIILAVPLVLTYLDTGMVPNWRDYFPEARVATHLGTGFDQPVTFRAGKSNPCGLEVES